MKENQLFLNKQWKKADQEWEYRKHKLVKKYQNQDLNPPVNNQVIKD